MLCFLRSYFSGYKFFTATQMRSGCSERESQSFGRLFYYVHKACVDVLAASGLVAVYG
jgi:hypothetical protein